MTINRQDFGVGGGGNGTLRCFLSKGVLAFLKNSSIRLELYTYNNIFSFDVLLSFDYFQSLFCDRCILIYQLIYLKEELKTPLKQVTS